MFEKPDPLTVGKKSSTSFYLPDALVKELKRSAAIDGVEARDRLSPYVTQLLVSAIRLRQFERRQAGEPK